MQISMTRNTRGFGIGKNQINVALSAFGCSVLPLQYKTGTGMIK
jgi:hypothetical protein